MGADSMVFRLYGKTLRVDRVADRWEVFYVGDEGKSRVARDIRVPPDLALEEISTYIEDLLHELATPK